MITQARCETGEILAKDWDSSLLPDTPVFVTGVGATTTYPDYKPAPFIVVQVEGVDMVTVVTEAYSATAA